MNNPQSENVDHQKTTEPEVVVTSSNLPPSNEGGGFPTRSEFIRDQFRKHPSMTPSQMDQAWRDAGYEGNIKQSLFYSVKNRLFQSSDDAEESTPAPTRASSRPNVERRPVVEVPSKSAFVRDFLKNNPLATASDVRVAWSDAGFPGELDPSIFYQAKRRMLTQAPTVEEESPRRGRGRPTSPPVASTTSSFATAAPIAMPAPTMPAPTMPAPAMPSPARAPAASKSGNVGAYISIERELDRLLHDALAIRDTELANSLLVCRRRVSARLM